MQEHNNSIANNTSLKPITAQLKEQIIHCLQHVPLNTAWGFTAKDFFENQHEKLTTDYEQLLHELVADIQDGPGTMQEILGPAYYFFRKLVL